jgi:hypothetical protein
VNDDFDISPRSVRRAAWRWSGTALGALAVVALVVLGGWRAGWWFAGQNANRQAHIIREGYSNQQTLREQITQQIANVDSIGVQIAQSAGDQAEVSALESQRIAVVNIACGDAAEVTGDPLPSSQARWVRSNCSAGVIRPGSKLDQTGN